MPGVSTEQLSEAAIREYQRILADLANVVTDEQLPRLLGILERLPDDCADLRRAFETNRNALAAPGTWLDALRILRFSVRLKTSLNDEYDNFVSAYQKLSSAGGGGENERKLLAEIGDLMYRIDDLSGEHERLATRLITQLSRSIQDTHGILMEPDEKLHGQPIPEDHVFRLTPLLRDLTALAAQLDEQLRIMGRLMRMRRLILEF